MRFWASSHSVMGLKGLKLDATGLAATLEKKLVQIVCDSGHPCQLFVVCVGGDSST